MDVVLGVAVTGPRACLALVGSAAQGADVIDESVVDLAGNPMQKLTETVVGTNRLLADENHRLLATRLYWSNPQSADRLRRALEDSGIQNVAVLSERQAAGALSGVGGSASGVRPDDDPTVALARGAAMAAGLPGDATAMSPTVGLTADATAMAPTVGLTADATAMAPTVQGAQSTGQVGPELAYSMAGDSDLLPMEWLTEPEDEDDAKTGPVGLGSRRLGAMDAVLGVAVAGSVARLALVGPVGGGYAAFKQLVVELPMRSFETLIQTVAETQRSLAAEGRHLVATRVYSPDHAQAASVRQALADSGVRDVGLVSEADAVTALLRTVFRGAALPGAVALVVAAEAATLLAPGAADALATVLATVALQGVDAATAAVDMLLEWLRSAPFAVDAAYVMGTVADLTTVAEQLRARSALRVEVLQRPEFAFARGAALAAGLAPTTPQPPIAAGAPTAMTPAAGLVGEDTAFAPAADPAAAEPQLAYSETDAGEPLGMDEYGDEYEDIDDDEAGTGPARLSRRSLVIGNAVIAFAVIGFVSLAAAVAITIRPTASQTPVVGLQNAAPGKFMPLLPTQQQAPVPAPPPDSPNAGYQGGVIPDSNGYIPPQLISPGAPATPVPESPGNPNGPIPAPVIVPYPGWRPPYPGWRPYPGWPYKPPPTWTTPSTPTTTPSTPTTSTSTPTITPYTPPTTPSTPPTTPPTTAPTTPPTTAPPTTPTTAPTTAPTTPPTAEPTTPHTTVPTTQPPTSQAPPATTAAPPPSTHAPTQQTVPTQPHTQPPVTQPPHTQPPVTQPPHTQPPMIPQLPHTTH